MTHIAAILLGALIVMVVFGFFYVIYTVIRHFGMSMEDALLTICCGALTLVMTWMLGTITMELLGII